MRTLILAFIICWSVGAATSANVTTLNIATLRQAGVVTPEIDYGPPDVFGDGTANEFALEFVDIEPAPSKKTTVYSTQVGASGAPFRMMKYAVTEAMIDKANALWNLNITMPFRQGANKPAGQIDQLEAFRFVNALNVAKGYHPAYNVVGSTFSLWENPSDWHGGTNGYRHKDAFYFLPSTHQVFDAAQWDPVGETWYNYGQGTMDPPTPVNGYFDNGSTSAGTAVYAQRFCDAFPEWDSTNVINVTLTTSGGAITAVAFDSYVSGHVIQITNSRTPEGTPYTVRQGANATGKVVVDTWQKISHVPGSFTNYVAGENYIDGAATITLAGNTVNVQIYTEAGGIIGVLPLGGRFASEDYSTELDIVQAGGSGGKCKVFRYTSTYYDGPQVPNYMSVHTAGSGYSDGPATITLHRAEWYPDLDPVSGLNYYKLTWGQSDVDRAGGESPQGVVGLFGNSSTMTDTADDFANNSTSKLIKYHGGWHFRGRTTPTDWRDLGNEAWNPNTPTAGAPTNGFRVASKAEEE